MSKAKTAIKLNIALNGDNKTIAFNLEDKFSDFIPLIQTTFKTNMNDYEIFISKEKVSNYDKTIKDIIGKDINPLFSLKKKDKPIINSPSKNLNTSTIETKELVTKVTIENFPSRPEMLEMLEKFVSQHGSSKDYKINNRDSAMDVIFKDSVWILLFRI
jgi:hypothetical protein